MSDWAIARNERSSFNAPLERRTTFMLCGSGVFRLRSGGARKQTGSESLPERVNTLLFLYNWGVSERSERTNTFFFLLIINVKVNDHGVLKNYKRANLFGWRAFCFSGVE